MRRATRVEPLPGKGGGNVGKTPKAGVAQRIGISRSDYAKREKREKREKLRKSVRRKIAAALGIPLAQLDF
ncbi:hypothetical protein F3J12_25050 [Burkholderia sp. Ax-1735]|nr:hypothetical protein [Burkholderia sp. Ap-955]NIF12728.1 hypothetical protein [Burkholderia sp. Ax-1735]NIG06131.1 hypothetical protein [Burkholderia sp. Tr-849]